MARLFVDIMKFIAWAVPSFGTPMLLGAVFNLDPTLIGTTWLDLLGWIVTIATFLGVATFMWGKIYGD